ncbi:hypothetical protein AN476_08670 [Phaeobacter sp. 11ANDIMAR09]|nr:hypothetical protein AN476_08670 [Phaeobacter sp. 11ANDIMAR09]
METLGGLQVYQIQKIEPILATTTAIGRITSNKWCIAQRTNIQNDHEIGVPVGLCIFFLLGKVLPITKLS